VPAELVPMSHGFKVKFGNHRDWINVIRTKARLNGTHQEEIVDCPRYNDVVFRQGPASRRNRGNSYYRELIDNFSLEHFRGDKDIRLNLVMLVIEKIESKGGRFLEWKNMWVVYQDVEQVRIKIASAFKQTNRKKKKGESEQLVQAIKITGNENNEFIFVPATKRLKFSENDDNSCFGKGFHPTESIVP
jgi:hypothetical protein